MDPEVPKCERDLPRVNHWTTSFIFASEIPLIEQLRIRGQYGCVQIAWLENKIYITVPCKKKMEVYSDHAPFHDLTDENYIDIRKLQLPSGIATSASSRSIFVSDYYQNSIWKIQIPQNELSRFDIGFYPTKMALTPNNELLVVEEYRDASLGNWYCFSIHIFRLTDFSQTKCIPIPRVVRRISCAGQSPNLDIVIAYSGLNSKGEYRGMISTLSMEGEFIRTFDPSLSDSFENNIQTPHSFTFKENGDIFVADSSYRGVLLFNSRLTDYQVMFNTDTKLYLATGIVYIKESQQLLVNSSMSFSPDDPVNYFNTVGMTNISIIHLSPCSLKLRKDQVLGDSNVGIPGLGFSHSLEQHVYYTEETERDRKLFLKQLHDWIRQPLAALQL